MPQWRKRALKQTRMHKQTREIVVCGADSETQHGPPISFQFYSDDSSRFTAIIQVDSENATRLFLRHLDRNCDPSRHYRIYGHYLEFDLLSFLWIAKHRLVENFGNFDFTIGLWKIIGCYGRPTFARITKSDGTLIELVDSALWFRGSLDNAAQTYAPDLPKLERPKDLGEKFFSIKDKEFAAYAMRDAEIAARLGKLIEKFHSDQELRPSMSLAGQAAQIFKTRYIDTPIFQCPGKFLEPAIAAYHGGKNNIIKRAAPAWHENATMYDISSAYPWAMTELPDFAHEEMYKEIDLPANAKSVPIPGIYKVSGKLANCDWPIFFSHDFKPLKNCEIEDLWIHGYELNEAIRAGEFKAKSRIKGCYYDSKSSNESAMSRFAKDFYKFKTNATNPIDRHMYKILLNCLSGKFIQTREQNLLNDDGTVSREHVAGGLFQPFIAGAITAHTRAHIHHIEHISNALHTATDGIIAPNKIKQSDLDGIPKSGLGSLNEEMTGNVILLRTKLYIGYDKDKGGIKSHVFKDWFIHKCALHGFQGNIKELEEMIVSGRRWYIAPHRIGLREAVKHGTIPNNFVQRQMFLQVGKVRPS